MKANWQELDGFWQPHDWQDYEHLINELPHGGTLVEIGSFRGKSLCSVADTIKRKNLRVISVDIFDQVDIENYDEPEVHKNRAGMFADFKANIDKFGLETHVTAYALDSITAANKLLAEGVLADMIFIDANHSYEAVRDDIAAWWPLVKEGGILAGHDFCHNGYQWPGTHKAITEFYPNPSFGVYIAAVRKIDGSPVNGIGLWK